MSAFAVKKKPIPAHRTASRESPNQLRVISRGESRGEKCATHSKRVLQTELYCVEVAGMGCTSKKWRRDHPDIGEVVYG
jgi:hypothetical protein